MELDMAAEQARLNLLGMCSEMGATAQYALERVQKDSNG